MNTNTIDFRSALRLKLHAAMVDMHNAQAVVDGRIVRLPGYAAAQARHDQLRATYDRVVAGGANRT